MAFARAIMTTDTYPKAVHQHAAEGSVTGFAKGSGMIHPNMATMLGFLLTDGHVDGPATAGLLRRVADRSFHRTTVDGDTSPNDTLLLLASGTNHGSTTSLEQLLTRTSQTLARTIAADGEGATRLVTVQVRGARDEAEATAVGRVVATSPLVKTAVAGRDPNWGASCPQQGAPGCSSPRPARESGLAPPTSTATAAPIPRTSRSPIAIWSTTSRSCSASTWPSAMPQPTSGPATSPPTTSRSTPTTGADRAR